jgi:D-proline reductase (dithiol) PrdB
MINSIRVTELMVRKYYPSFKFTIFSDTPVTPLSKPLNECKLALVTTGGLHLKIDPPFDFSIKEGDSSYRMIPADMNHRDILVSHKWYDHKFITADINCVFPIDRMREYVSENRIGSLSEEHYSFMGHIYDTDKLMVNAKKLGRHLTDLGVDIAFLTPT